MNKINEIMSFAKNEIDNKTTIIQISYHIEDGKIMITDNEVIKEGTGNVLYHVVTYQNIGNVEHDFSDKELERAWIDWAVAQL